MLQIPAQLVDQFTNYIGQHGIPAGQHRYYLKWMRYYLDFCHKYRFEQRTDASLAAFLKKLDQKNQSTQQQKQAEQAVRSYFACVQSSKKQQDFGNKDNTLRSTTIPPNTYSNNRQEDKSLEIEYLQPEASAKKKKTTRQKGADWTGVFAEFKNGIRVRHYSRATLKTYTGWVRKFQMYVCHQPSRRAPFVWLQTKAVWISRWSV